MSKVFYVTFGQKYRREQHPQSINGVYPHPDGWMVVEARDREQAIRITETVFSRNYSMIYDSEPDMLWFPYGKLGRIS